MTRFNKWTAATAVFVALAGAPAVASPVNGPWEIGPVVRGVNYSINMPARPSEGPNGARTFAFPLAGAGEVDALTTPVGPLSGARSITLRYRIDAARGTRFVPSEAPGAPATVSLYFQQAGDDWSGRGRYVSYRWYAPARSLLVLSPGVHSVTVRLDDRWTNVHGGSSTDLPDAYDAARRNAVRLGIAFGSADLRSHGVAATAPARFTLLGVSID